VHGAQVVTLRAATGEPISFAPDATSSIERRIGHLASRGLDRQTVAVLAGHCDASAAGAIFVEPSGWSELRGTVTRTSDHRRQLTWIASVVLLVATIGGALGYRRLAARAELERAEALIAERFGRIDGG
jgi:hypothetical protein